MEGKVNILICGTPGVGKTSFSKELSAKINLQHVEVSQLITEHKLFLEYDDELNCSIFDENMVQTKLEEVIEETSHKGCIVDFHSVEFLEAIPFKLVIVLRTEIGVLSQRLEGRNYPEGKIRENVECEIFQMLLDEASASFEDVKILELQSNTVEDVEANLEKVLDYLKEEGL